MALKAAADTMTVLGLFPLEFEADRSGAAMLAEMPRSALVVRSTGPYGREKLPPEAMRMVELIQIRWMSRPERPELALDVDRRRARLMMTFPVSGLEVTLVVPEDAPPGYRPTPGNVTVEISVKIALDLLAESLRVLAFDAPLTVRLSYPKRRAAAGSWMRGLDLPVEPTIELDRRRLSRQDRKRHTAYLIRALDPSGARRAPMFGSRIDLRSGVVRIRDAA
jgi:hypothetical protein